MSALDDFVDAGFVDVVDVVDVDGVVDVVDRVAAAAAAAAAATAAAAADGGFDTDRFKSVMSIGHACDPDELDGCHGGGDGACSRVIVDDVDDDNGGMQL